MKRTFGTIQGNRIIEQDDHSITFLTGATLDGDGANGQFGHPPCYAPKSFRGATLDVLGNAGKPGNWYGVLTDTNDSRGIPLVQDKDDPCLGAYISTTSLHLLDKEGKRLPNSSPFKYVDSATVPFVVVPPIIIQEAGGIVLGCRCVVTNTASGQKTEAVVADVGPRNRLGEMSVACARALGLPLGGAHPANGGGMDAPAIHYQLFPGTAAVVNGVTYPLQES